MAFGLLGIEVSITHGTKRRLNACHPLTKLLIQLGQSFVLGLQIDNRLLLMLLFAIVQRLRQLEILVRLAELCLQYLYQLRSFRESVIVFLTVSVVVDVAGVKVAPALSLFTGLLGGRDRGGWLALGLRLEATDGRSTAFGVSA